MEPVCRILTSFSYCGGYPQPPGRGGMGMTASFPYLGDGCTNYNVCGLGIFPALQALHSATTDVP